MSSALCHLCVCYDRKTLSHLLDKDLGPLCVDCFAAALRAETELRWSCLTYSPSDE
jgi:hypothetical protein